MCDEDGGIRKTSLKKVYLMCLCLLKLIVHFKLPSAVVLKDLLEASFAFFVCARSTVKLEKVNKKK